MTRFALDERYELADTLRDVGPGAPTLSAPWTSTELLAHLILRERSLVEVAGRLPVRVLQQQSDRVLQKYARAHTYPAMVEALRVGPPAWSPFYWPPLRERVDLLEYAIHHEDVRRANHEGHVAPRIIPVARSQAMWRMLTVAARMLFRPAPVGVALEWPGAPGGPATSTAKQGPDPVRVTGEPLELALVAFGRQGVAQVDWDGTPTAVTKLQAAKLGL